MNTIGEIIKVEPGIPQLVPGNARVAIRIQLMKDGAIVAQHIINPAYKILDIGMEAVVMHGTTIVRTKSFVLATMNFFPAALAKSACGFHPVKKDSPVNVTSGVKRSFFYEKNYQIWIRSFRLTNVLLPAGMRKAR